MAGLQVGQDPTRPRGPQLSLTQGSAGPIEVKWYRSTFYNVTILGLCNFAAPGIWSAMNSLGAGGTASPRLTNSANAVSTTTTLPPA